MHKIIVGRRENLVLVHVCQLDFCRLKYSVLERKRH
jgi:hypothetical protein